MAGHRPRGINDSTLLVAYRKVKEEIIDCPGCCGLGRVVDGVYEVRCPVCIGDKKVKKVMTTEIRSMPRGTTPPVDDVPVITAYKPSSGIPPEDKVWWKCTCGRLLFTVGDNEPVPEDCSGCGNGEFSPVF